MKNFKNFVNKSTSNKFLNFRLYFNKKYQNKDIHKWFQKKIDIKKTNISILDVGCGTGAQSFFFSKKIGIKGKLYAFDKSQNSINNLKKKLKKKNIKIFQGDMNKFNQINKNIIQEEKFDIISAVYSIYYAKKPIELIKQLLKKLKKNGKLIIFLPTKPNKIAEIAEKFYFLPKKVNESLIIHEKIEQFCKKNKLYCNKKFFRSKMRINNLSDVIKFYQSTTFYNKRYENNVYEYLNKKFDKKIFIFKKDSCLLTLKNVHIK